MKSILVLCEGNICRSPMAEGLLAAGLPDMSVRSAGLGALVGKPADETAVALMRDRGIDIAGHRAVQVNRAMCVESDVILVMDGEQRQRLQKMYPEVHGRVFRIGEYADTDVPDP
jgi:protein-tyrosine phosphatase